MPACLVSRALLICCVLAGTRLLPAAPYPPEGLVTQWRQPDGTLLDLRVMGDEFYARTTTADGFTVLFDESAQAYVYAAKEAGGRELASSGVVVTAGKPPRGLERHLTELPEKVRAVRQGRVRTFAPDRAARWNARVQAGRSSAAGAKSAPGDPAIPAADAIQAVPLAGTQAGLTILVQFPDDPATAAVDPVMFPAPREKLERWANQTGYTDDGNTGSVRDYFYDQSSGQLTLTQRVTRVVTLPYPRSYYNYSDYPANQTVRPNAGVSGRMLLADAVAKLRSEGFDFSGLSKDSANRVLATSVLFAGPDSGIWAKGLWPHAWSLASNLNVGPAGSPSYIFRYQITNLANAAPVIGTFIHELGHLLLDYPDLYDTDPSDGDSEGVGQHCLMGSGNFQNGGRTPAPINLYLKQVSGWANLTDLTPDQALDGSLPSTGNVGYRIRKPGLPTEYFLFENRGPGDKWTAGALDTGIIVWHVDELVSGNDYQQMSPSNHYEVSVEQSDGRFDLERGANRGDNTDFFDLSSPFFTNDTNPDADWWNGSPSQIRMQALSGAAATMNLRFGGSAPAEYLGVSPTTLTIPAAGGTFTISVSGSGSWTGVRSTAWVNTTEARTQSGTQSYTYTVAPNPGSAVRTTSFNFTQGGLTAVHAIVQSGIQVDDHGNAPASATLLGQDASLAGGINYARDHDYFRINVAAAGALTLQSTGSTDTYGYLLNAGGVTVAEDDDSGDGFNFRISYPVTAGTYYVGISHFDATLTGNYTMVSSFASGGTLTLTPAVQAVPGTGGSYTFTVNSNTVWNWSASAPWVQSAEAASQSGPQSFTYTVPAQSVSTPRSAVITLTAGTVTATHTINQSVPPGDDHGDTPAAATLIEPASTTPGVIGVPGDEDFFKVTLVTAGTLTLRTTGTLDTTGTLLNASGTELVSDDDDVDSNFRIERQLTPGTYYLQLGTYLNDATGNYVLVSTFVPEPFFALSSPGLPMAAAGGDGTVEIGANVAWSWSSNQSWLTASAEAASQTGPQTFDFRVAPNPTTATRRGILSFQPAGLDPVFLTVSQAGTGPVISVHPQGTRLWAGETGELQAGTPASLSTWQWYAGLAGDISQPVPGATAAMLRIAPAESASYWVRLTGPGGTTDSMEAWITVDRTPAGLTWTLAAPATGANLRSVIHAGHQWIACGDSGAILTSPDGMVWTSRTPGSSAALESLAWNGSLAVAVGSGGTILTSSDGVVWTSRISGLGTTLKQVTWDGSAWHALSDGARRRSPDGISWQNLSSSGAGIQSFRWLEGQYCVTGTNYLATSPDAATWTTRLTTPGVVMTDVASNGSSWLTASSDGTVRLSQDRGVTWSSPRSVSTGNLLAVASDGAGFIAAGAGGKVYVSPDSLVWTPGVTGVTSTLQSLAWNGSRLVAVGDQGKILWSDGAWQGARALNYHAWAIASGLNEGLAAGMADPDRDGLANSHEFLHGTHPLRAEEAVRLMPVLVEVDGQAHVRLSFPWLPRADVLNARLQRSPDGMNWTDLTPSGRPDGTGYTELREWGAPLGPLGGSQFFRFRYLRP